METFRPARPLAADPHFSERREKALAGLAGADIDKPIRGLISDLARIPYCFTLQSCWGHFVYGEHKDPNGTDPLPPCAAVRPVEYRIAYLALCIEDCDEGSELLKDLGSVTRIDPEYIQFGSPAWFWERQVNSYALQVEPLRFRDRDSVFIGYQEALCVQSVRDAFWKRLVELINARLS